VNFMGNRSREKMTGKTYEERVANPKEPKKLSRKGNPMVGLREVIRAMMRRHMFG